MRLVRTTHYALSGAPTPIERPLTDTASLVLIKRPKDASVDPGALPEIPEVAPPTMTLFEERLDELAEEVRGVKDTVNGHDAALSRIESGLKDILAMLGTIANGVAR